MKTILTDLLPGMSDQEVLDLLDEVSGEVKRRNSLICSPDVLGDPDALKRAADVFAQMIKGQG